MTDSERAPPRAPRPGTQLRACCPAPAAVQAPRSVAGRDRAASRDAKQPPPSAARPTPVRAAGTAAEAQRATRRGPPWHIPLPPPLLPSSPPPPPSPPTHHLPLAAPRCRERAPTLPARVRSTRACATKRRGPARASEPHRRKKTFALLGFGLRDTLNTRTPQLCIDKCGGDAPSIGWCYHIWRCFRASPPRRSAHVRLRRRARGPADQSTSAVIFLDQRSTITLIASVLRAARCRSEYVLSWVVLSSRDLR